MCINARMFSQGIKKRLDWGVNFVSKIWRLSQTRRDGISNQRLDQIWQKACELANLSKYKVPEEQKQENVQRNQLYDIAENL